MLHNFLVDARALPIAERVALLEFFAGCAFMALECRNKKMEIVGLLVSWDGNPAEFIRLIKQHPKCAYADVHGWDLRDRNYAFLQAFGSI